MLVESVHIKNKSQWANTPEVSGLVASACLVGRAAVKCVESEPTRDGAKIDAGSLGRDNTITDRTRVLS